MPSCSSSSSSSEGVKCQAKPSQAKWPDCRYILTVEWGFLFILSLKNTYHAHLFHTYLIFILYIYFLTYLIIIYYGVSRIIIAINVNMSLIEIEVRDKRRQTTCVVVSISQSLLSAVCSLQSKLNNL